MKFMKILKGINGFRWVVDQEETSKTLDLKKKRVSLIQRDIK